MKVYLILFLVVILFAFATPTLADSTTVTILDGALIHFGGGVQNDAALYVEKDNGRKVGRTIELPISTEPTSITARLLVDSDGDPWDRAATIYLNAPGHKNIEILKFITGFGGRSELELDVTYLAPMLQGECDIYAFVDTWVNPGWIIDFELVYKTDESIQPAAWNNGVYFEWSLNRASVEQDTPTVKINIPSTQERIMLTYYASGHATDGTGGDEFETKFNKIAIDGVDMLRYKPWRDDCRDFRDRNPTSGRWGDTWSSDFSRSGWCPGDIVYPHILDVTWFLQQGEHELTYLIENIRPSDNSGTGYWRTSSFLSGWGDINQWQPIEMILSGPENNTFQRGGQTQLRIDLVDNLGYNVIKSDASIEFSCDQDSGYFSLDQENWPSTVTVPVRYGSGVVWFKGEKTGAFQISARDVSGVLPSPQPVTLIFNSYEPNPSEQNLALQNIGVNADCECNPSTERVAFAVDGDLTTKWCCNNGGTDWMALILPAVTPLNYFIVRHAGAGEAPQGDPGYNDNSGQNTRDFNIQTRNDQGEWVDAVTMVGNPQTEQGDVSYHLLEEAVESDEVRLLINNQGGDNASRIYEFEMYNRNATKIDKETFETATLPKSLHLFNNYPNPFNNSTKLEFFVPQVGKAVASIISADGRVVKHLLSGQIPQGRQALTWDGTNMNNQSVSSGVYFFNVRFTDEDERSVSKSMKLMLVK
jgi:hypothetical protein